MNENSSASIKVISKPEKISSKKTNFSKETETLSKVLRWYKHFNEYEKKKVRVRKRQKIDATAISNRIP
jgi:hypothetical protein